MAKQSRKSSQSRRRRRRARRGGTPTVLVLLCVLVAVVAIITAMTIFFKVQSFTLIDRIFDACPYLDTVQMRRRYPDRIEIIVTECVPIVMLDDLSCQIPDPEDGEKTVSAGGTGWWLLDKEGKLHILKEANGSNPIRQGMKPLLGFDVWEHAYYLDFQNRRADHISRLWDIIDWNTVENRM